MIQFGLLFWGLDQGGEALRFMPRRSTDGCRASSRRASRALNAPPAPFVPEQYHFAARLRAGRSSASGRPRSTPRPSTPVRGALPAAVRVRHADAVHRAAADVRRGQLLGAALLREGRLPRRAHRRRDRGRHRARAAQDLAAVARCCSTGSTRPTARRATDARRSAGGRDPRYGVFIAARPGRRDAARRAGVGRGSSWDALRPLAVERGTYVNAMTEPTSDRVRAAYGREVRAAGRGSRPSTTRATSSTGTSTSSPPEA